jgi:phenylacetate-CoA ligase
MPRASHDRGVPIAAAEGLDRTRSSGAERLNNLLAEIVPRNPFYAAKLQNCPQRLDRLEQLSEFPFTTKEDLADAAPDVLRTYLIERYVRFHQTSGTHGRPLPVLDTAADWQWWIDCWQYVLDAAEVTADDRALLAFSFGPFIGFWSAHDALAARGALTIPSGGMNSLSRLELMERTGATVLCCTPSYALRLVEVAAEHKIGLHNFTVRRIIVAGEPGGSQPAVRQRIEEAWQAQVIDHAGATEVGPWGYADAERRGLHIIESEFIAEFLDLETGEPTSADGLAHLILTPLGRRGMPVIRYRTGDIVRPTWPESGPNRFVLVEGGVLARADDMLIIRGVNVFPSAVDQILRSFPRGRVPRHRLQLGEMTTWSSRSKITCTSRAASPRSFGAALPTRPAEPLSLPRSKVKRRFIDASNDRTLATK